MAILIMVVVTAMDTALATATRRLMPIAILLMDMATRAPRTLHVRQLRPSHLYLCRILFAAPALGSAAHLSNPLRQALTVGLIDASHQRLTLRARCLPRGARHQ
jgi:hypothetical protein